MNFALLAEIIADSVFDSLSLFPFLFVTYLVLEYIERHAKEKSLDLIGNAGKWGPFAGGLAGLVPQCGFAAAAANFYWRFYCQLPMKCCRLCFQIRFRFRLWQKC